MQGGLVRRKVPVRLSVKRVDCDKTEDRSVQIFKPCSERQLNSTEQRELQSWPSFRLATWCQHQYQYQLVT